MRSVFDGSVRYELTARVATVREDSPAVWGKMNAYQMVRHCTLFDVWMLGKEDPVYMQSFLGKIIGGFVLRRMLKDDSPIARNMPTTSDLIINETEGDLAAEKQRWTALILDYENYDNPRFIHDFFGKMTLEQIGHFAYKHSDHHLRQFSA